MKRLFGAIVALALIAAIGYGVYMYIHRRAQSGRIRLLDAEYSYLAALKDILQKQPDPESQNSLSVFVSGNSLNAVLAGANGTSVDLTKPSGTTLKLASVRTEFRDGFPGVVAEIQVASKNPALSFDAQLYGVLEPRIDKTDPTNLLLYFHPLYVGTGTQPMSNSNDLAKITDGLLSELIGGYAQQLPHLTIPLAQEFSVSFPPNHLPFPVPVQAGQLNGEVDVPGLSLHSTIAVSGVLFLSDGVHAFVAARLKPTDVTPQPIFPYQIDERVPSFADAKALDAAVKQKEEQIQSMRTGIDSLTSPLKVANSDFRIWVSRNLLTAIADVFNSLAPNERLIHFHTLSEQGQLYRTGGGGAGCGGYAELVGGNSASANLQIGNLTSSWTAGQGLAESADFQFSFDGQVTGHVNGPAGPHTTMVLNCVNLGFARPCTDLPSVTISCDTPIGGGVGLGSYGVHGDRTERITVNMALHSDPSSWLIYDVAIASPNQIPITVQVGLGPLGTAGIPINFDVPHQVMLSGKAPSIFSQTGVLENVAAHFSKKYGLTIAPTAGTVLADGYAAVGTINVQWQ